MMKLTKEQWADIERQRQENPDARRFYGHLTEEQKAEYARMVAIEEAGREENLKKLRPTREALNEPGFSGVLRRAIVSSGRNPIQLQEETGCDASNITRFLRGEQSLPTDDVDRLITTLGLSAKLEASA